MQTVRGALGCAVALVVGSSAAVAQAPGSLKSVPVPKPTNLGRYVADPNTLVALGKALFWDMQLSSDGRVACATCHFHAGADHRAQNQLSNPLGAFVLNYTLTAADFPFHVLTNINDNRSQVLRDSGQRAASAGMFRRIFADIIPNTAAEDGLDAADTPAFILAGLNVRQAGLRNTPSVINAVFYVRNFWDGRASNIFTGVTPFGNSDPRANVLAFNNGQLTAERVQIDNASLASQAVGPPLNPLEMAYDGRTWPKAGRKLLTLSPLALQRVAADDSVLGPFANPDGRGLAPRYTYLWLVQTAFQPAYWSSPQAAGDFTQAESNFAFFLGLAIQAYESTLVSDDTPFDQFEEGHTDAMTAAAQAGLQLFRGRGNCSRCHAGAETTSASVGNSVGRGGAAFGTIATDGDNGFANTGVRPSAEDIGLAGKDDFGNPLQPGPQTLNGFFKVPGLRNVEFTGPYFHNGGQGTLDQVIDFYSRAGDFPAENRGSIRALNLSPGDRGNLVAFLKSLSDDRVRFERAPFDHPELCIPIGQLETSSKSLQAQASDPRFALSAADKWAGIPAVGRGGNTVPLQTFDELLLGIGTDGSRAHTLTDACTTP